MSGVHHNLIGVRIDSCDFCFEVDKVEQIPFLALPRSLAILRSRRDNPLKNLLELVYCLGLSRVPSKGILGTLPTNEVDCFIDERTRVV